MFNIFNCRLALLILCAFNTIPLMAQQKPHYTQYILNNYALNPALSGIENYTDIKIAHRHQWAGFDGAPVTSYLTAHFPIGKKDLKTSVTSFSVPGENPLGQRYWEEYTAAPAHHGAGIQVFNDQIGPFNDFSAMATYAYHMPINTKTNISAGLGLGVGRLSLNAGKLFFGNDYPVDPSVFTDGDLNKMRVNMSAGVWLYSANYFAGISAQELLPNKINFSDNAVNLSNGKWVPHIFGTAGFRFMLTDDINAVPSVMVKYISPVPVQIEMNCKLQYHDLLWAGASYRHKYGFAAFAGMNLFNAVQFSYSYDYSTTRLNKVSNGTHEVLLGFIIGNRYSDQTCPRNVW